MIGESNRTLAECLVLVLELDLDVPPDRFVQFPATVVTMQENVGCRRVDRRHEVSRRFGQKNYYACRFRSNRRHEVSRRSGSKRYSVHRFRDLRRVLVASQVEHATEEVAASRNRLGVGVSTDRYCQEHLSAATALW